MTQVRAEWKCGNFSWAGLAASLMDKVCPPGTLVRKLSNDQTMGEIRTDTKSLLLGLEATYKLAQRLPILLQKAGEKLNLFVFIALTATVGLQFITQIAPAVTPKS